MYRALTRAHNALVAVIGIEEVAIYAALALIAAGCWQAWRPGSYLFPGLVMLWMYLPQRKAFIERHVEIAASAEPVRRRKP